MCGGNGIKLINLLRPTTLYYVAFVREGNDGFRPIPDYNLSLKSYQEMVVNLASSGANVFCSARVLREEIPTIKRALDAQEGLPGVKLFPFISVA